MAEKTVSDLLARLERMKGARRAWEGTWQEIAERFRPVRADFTGARHDGPERRPEIFDTTGEQAARGLAASIDAMLKSEADDWFEPRAADEPLGEDTEARAWLGEVKARMRRAIYAAPARFGQRSGEVDLDLVTFGTGVLFVGEQVGRGALLFQSCHLRDAYVAENHEGDIDTVFRVLHYTPRQAVQAFGVERVGRKTRELAEKGKGEDERLPFLHAVMPRAERDPGRGGGRAMPWASVWVDVASEHLIGEGGFHEFPFAVPRWETVTSEVYGRSPAMAALPDVKTVNEIARTLLAAGQKAVDPPLLLADESVVGAVNTFPGGLTYVDAQRFHDGGRPPVLPLVTGANIPLGREMQIDVRQMIWDAFLRSVLQLPADNPNMTATEVVARQREFVRAAGPVFGRLKADYVGRLLPRAFRVLERAGALPERPPALEGAEIVFECRTEVDRAIKAVEAAKPALFAQQVAPYMATHPQMLEHIDFDTMARDIAEEIGFRPRWVLPRAAVAAEREARAAAEAEAAQAAQTLAGAAPGGAPGAGAEGLVASLFGGAA